MATNKRADRVAERIRQELSVLILNRLKDPRIGFVTLTRVEVTEDLSYAKVYFSVLGTTAEVKSTAAALEHSVGFLQRSLKDALPIKVIPKIVFKFDPNLEHAMKIDKILNQIHDEKP